MSLNFYTEEEDNNKEESINNYKYLFSQYANNLPTLREALNQMFKSANIDDIKINELTNDILDKCKKKIDPEFNEIKKEYNNISKDDSYIICSYTCESKDKRYSPYRLLNQNLVSDDRKKGAENISKYLYIFLNSLRKLPRYYPTNQNKYLYRCITHKVSLSKDPFNEKLVPYNNGNKKTFWGFTSTSTNPKVTYNFLDVNEKNIKAGTVFSLGGDVWGYNIEMFNYFGEKEILLEPERKFIVDNVLPPLNDIINVTCTILKTPLILSKNEKEDNIKINNIIREEKMDKKIDNLDINNINKYIIKIKIKNNEGANNITGIGVLCDIPEKYLKALITYNDIIDFDLLNSIEKIKILINNEEVEIDMKLDRFKYTYKELNLTIIEILKEDNITNLIELEQLNDSKNYIDKDIMCVYLKADKNFGILNSKIKSKNFDVYQCSIIESLNEGIIVSKDNLKLIGLTDKNNNKKEIKIISIDKIISKINFIKCMYRIDMYIPNPKFSNSIFTKIKMKRQNDGNKIIHSKEISEQIDGIVNGKIISNLYEYEFNISKIYIIYLVSRNNLLNTMKNMFSGCSSLITINLSSFDTSKVTDMSDMFQGCSSLVEINLSKFDTSQVTNMRFMFEDCHSLKEINLSSFNTSLVTNMSSMFYGCRNFKELNLSSFNTSQVTNMSSMFANCEALKELDLSPLNTSNVTDMSEMFCQCSSLEKINLSALRTYQVKDMSSMFLNCYSLKEINVSSFNTNQVTNMSMMFDGCKALKEINLASFNTSKVINMSSMFAYSSSLNYIDLSTFTTGFSTDISDMFTNCTSLKNVKCEDRRILNKYQNNPDCIII